MDKYKIKVTFRKNNFIKHNIESNSEISGIVEMITDRCDVEAILADCNVHEYQIVDCDNKLQIMKKSVAIPNHYYDDEMEES